MRHLSTALFLLAGLINLYPVIGGLGAPQLQSLYGLPVAGEDLLLLMRHRAVLLGLLGAFLILAAFRAEWRGVAAMAGLISMLSFVFLSLPLATHSAALQRVSWADIIASVLLVAGHLAGRKWT